MYYLTFNLKKHICSRRIDAISGDLIIADTNMWQEDIRNLYLDYVNCIPPKRSRHLNFKPVNIDKVHIEDLYEGFERARVALEAYIYLHWLKGDIHWQDECHFFKQITRKCVITKEMIVRDSSLNSIISLMKARGIKHPEKYVYDGMPTDAYSLDILCDTILYDEVDIYDFQRI